METSRIIEQHFLFIQSYLTDRERESVKERERGGRERERERERERSRERKRKRIREWVKVEVVRLGRQKGE